MKRSIQWRIQLGLLPTPSSPVVVCSNNNDEDDYSTTTAVAAVHNRMLIEKQRLEYCQLSMKHPYPTTQPNETEFHDISSSSEQRIDKNGDIHKNPNKKQDTNNLDPLTALILEEQVEQTRQEQMDLEYRKQVAASKRTKNKNWKDKSRVMIESEDYDERYVTIEMLEKDLNRLPLLFMDDDTDDSIKTTTPGAATNNNPLSDQFILESETQLQIPAAAVHFDDEKDNSKSKKLQQQQHQQQQQ